MGETDFHDGGSLGEAADELVRRLTPLRFGGEVAGVYNPLEYARAPYDEYLRRYLGGTKRVVFLGMNPGPYGMVQTGVPFGEVAAVRDWMKISCPVGQPANPHPRRPVQGFDCLRSEVSGRRLWGLFAERFGTPEEFFAEHAVINFCPLVWMTESGRNITPDKLPAAELAPVEAACHDHLVAVLRELKPEFLIGIGAYAERKLAAAAKEIEDRSFKIGRILHPSPASPAANRGWAEAATRQLVEQGVWRG